MPSKSSSAKKSSTSVSDEIHAVADASKPPYFALPSSSVPSTNTSSFKSAPHLCSRFSYNLNFLTALLLPAKGCASPGDPRGDSGSSLKCLALIFGEDGGEESRGPSDGEDAGEDGMEEDGEYDMVSG